MSHSVSGCKPSTVSMAWPQVITFVAHALQAAFQKGHASANSVYSQPPKTVDYPATPLDDKPSKFTLMEGDDGRKVSQAQLPSQCCSLSRCHAGLSTGMSHIM